jgi:hypothetical protein
MPRGAVVDYTPPPRHYEEETQETDEVEPRRQEMGEAKDIVKSKPESVTPLHPRSPHGLIGRVTCMIDDLDRAIEVKQGDLDAEGFNSLPENHTKLGLLMASMALLRRTKAMLEDYGKDLDDELDPTLYPKDEQPIGDALKADSGDDGDNDDYDDYEVICPKCDNSMEDCDCDDDPDDDPDPYGGQCSM